MRIRILGFAATVAALGWLGYALVGMPDAVRGLAVAQQEPEVPSEPESPPPPEPDELDTRLRLEGEETEDVEEDRLTAAELRREAEEARERAAELREQAEREMERGRLAERQAEALEAGGEVTDEGLDEEEELPGPAELAARIAAIEERLAELQVAGEDSALEIAELEEQLAALEEQGELLEASRLQRIDTLEGGMDELRNLNAILATGEGDVDAALDALSVQFGATSDEAARYAGEEEARLAASAQQAVEAARQALARQDLYNARVALGIALSQARAAREAAMTAGPAGLP